MAHIIASDTDIDLTTLDCLRVRCVQDAMRTHGEIDFTDILKFQKGLIWVSKLIQKSGYIKSGGNAGGYMKYIATRERVEKLDGNGSVSRGQLRLMENILRDFPDAKELHEYADYEASPTFGNASAFITMALDANAHELHERDGYMRYIATRPRAERHGNHGVCEVLVWYDRVAEQDNQYAQYNLDKLYAMGYKLDDHEKVQQVYGGIQLQCWLQKLQHLR